MLPITGEPTPFPILRIMGAGMAFADPVDTICLCTLLASSIEKLEALKSCQLISTPLTKSEGVEPLRLSENVGLLVLFFLPDSIIHFSR